MFNSELVKIVNGQIVTTSRKVAEVFEKQHKVVLRAIRDLEISEDYRERNFAPTVYEQPNPSGGKPIQRPEYLITKDGFVLLAMGFTGKKAMQFKIAYIEAFNAMEEQLKQNFTATATISENPQKEFIRSSYELLTMLNENILAGQEVDRDVLRYARGVAHMVGKQVASKTHKALPVDFVEFVENYPCGEFSRCDVYNAYCAACANPMSARCFWPRARKVRNFREKRNYRGRLIIFE